MSNHSYCSNLLRGFWGIWYNFHCSIRVTTYLSCSSWLVLIVSFSRMICLMRLLSCWGTILSVHCGLYSIGLRFRLRGIGDKGSTSLSSIWQVKVSSNSCWHCWLVIAFRDPLFKKHYQLSSFSVDSTNLWKEISLSFCGKYLDWQGETSEKDSNSSYFWSSWWDLKVQLLRRVLIWFSLKFWWVWWETGLV